VFLVAWRPQCAPHRSEEQAAGVLRAAESEVAVDSWGGLAKLDEVTSSEVMRRLAKDERAVRSTIPPPRGDHACR
jgi:hypothetical protein